MKQETEEIELYDVAIIGAGPAGCTCALALKNAGLKVAIFDKSHFPRNKVCGDAIPGRAIKTLKSISPIYEAAFKQFPKKYETRTTKLLFNKREISVKWVLDAYTCTRREFDNFLFNLVKEHTVTEIFTGESVNQIEKHEDQIYFTTAKGRSFKTKIMVGADGAQSLAAKKLANKTMNRNHYVASVRAYYTNVAGLEQDTTYVYLHKDFLPSYLWVFPLPGNIANVGIGMQSGELVKRKMNLKRIFYEFIDTMPELSITFQNAQQVGELEGFGLPLGSSVDTISGYRFLLAGDAASLIDPATGDGIGNATLSGKLAAQMIIASFKQNDFSADFFKQYDTAVINAIGKELKTHYKLQRILTMFPFLFTFAFWLYGLKLFKNLMKKLF